MTRRTLTMTLALAVATLVAGCSTFSDSDAIARVDDVELGDDQLDELLPIVAGEEIPEEAVVGATRTAIGVWLEAQVFSQAIDDAGVELDASALETNTSELAARFPTFDDLSDRSRDLLVEYVTGLERLPDVPRPPENEVATWFNGGIDSSGLACVSHILVETEDEAEEILAELDDVDGGNDAEAERFAELAMERSTDPGSAESGGFLTCDLAENISQQFVPPFAEAVLGATPGVPTGPVESDIGFHVIRLGTFGESAPMLEQFYESGYIQARLLIDDADVYVDPRYGTADGVNVIPLG